MGRWNGGYIRNFPLLPFGVPIAPTVLGVGGPTRPKFGVVVDLLSVLGNFVFVFR